jgi:hypothetical protein
VFALAFECVWGKFWVCSDPLRQTGVHSHTQQVGASAGALWYDCCLRHTEHVPVLRLLASAVPSTLARDKQCICSCCGCFSPLFAARSIGTELTRDDRKKLYSNWNSSFACAVTIVISSCCE